LRFHLPALPGQPVTADNSTCAFTQKVRKFADMMVPRGHEVNVYGDPQHDSLGDHVACYEPGEPPPFTADGWATANAAAVNAIKERAEPGDVLGLIGGTCQQPLIREFPELYPVEFGIGYPGVNRDGTHRVFESYAWMHQVYGELYGSGTADGRFYDAVIHGYFDRTEFPKGDGGDYLLYVGRMIERKGVQIACETAEAAGMRLILAGGGDFKPTYGDHIGVVEPKERGVLMAGARALICPTTYIEPFGSIAAEAQLCGTPVIATDFGAFTETVTQGVTGYRCRRLGEFVWAAQNADRLDRRQIRERAIKTWSLEAIAPAYENYFDHLLTLRDKGWYDARPQEPCW
jgi:hypothetical protein